MIRGPLPAGMALLCQIIQIFRALTPPALVPTRIELSRFPRPLQVIGEHSAIQSSSPTSKPNKPSAQWDALYAEVCS
jgi:hypothetical protein